MKKLTKLMLLPAIGVLLAACSTPKKLTYLRDLEYNVPEVARPAPELRLKVDDRISIQVFSDQMELAAPFNAAGVNIEGDDGSLLSSTYGVDARGNIDFPVLGEIHVEGKTLNEVQKDISAEITRRGYIKDPVVKAELENFTVTVIGQMGQQILPVEGGSLNLIQLLAQLDGELETAKIPDVMVIRTENGMRQAYQVNFQTKELYNSPVFYLQQNDVVYVKPRGLLLSSGGDLFLKYFSPIASTLTSAMLVVVYLKK
ncbi:MAG: polysaccharide biosynthesis/export family protein [Bacteroidales bacterium]|jgi:polysaccharide export outer membrane protein|nr:polysaccharide biosynthesis/export family protein [Bacteroidales bacterium]MBP5558613.1 polysaccharide biosynthesis/export family protein [Bacteroidales bacterium]